MAIPPHVETERGKQLHEISVRYSFSDLMAWPGVTSSDAIHIFQIITDFSHIDLVMRILLGNIDRHDPASLDPQWRGVTSKLKTWQVEKALKTCRWLPDDREGVFDRIARLRGFRNLVAHFVIRRFPADDAFLFVTQSESDFRKVFGRTPLPGTLMMSFLDGPELDFSISEVGQVAEWISRVATIIEPALMQINSPSGPASG